MKVKTQALDFHVSAVKFWRHTKSVVSIAHRVVKKFAGI